VLMIFHLEIEGHLDSTHPNPVWKWCIARGNRGDILEDGLDLFLLILVQSYVNKAQSQLRILADSCGRSINAPGGPRYSRLAAEFQSMFSLTPSKLTSLLASV